MRVRVRFGNAMMVVALSMPAVGLAAIPYGPGPQAHYVVRTQPPTSSCHYRYTRTKQPLPDHRCTPGARNPRVKPATLKATICKSRSTASIRPPGGGVSGGAG